jgi:hypothetical protein
MTDAELYDQACEFEAQVYRASKWLSSKKKETRAAEMPQELVEEFGRLFGNSPGTNGPINGPIEKITDIWKAIS